MVNEDTIFMAYLFNIFNTLQVSGSRVCSCNQVMLLPGNDYHRNNLPYRPSSAGLSLTQSLLSLQ